MRKLLSIWLVFTVLAVPLDAQEDPLATALEHIREDEYAQAIAIYDDYLEDHPEDAQVYTFRALVYAELDDYDSAFEGMETALEIAQGTLASQILTLRAELHVRAGDTDSAFADYDAAVEIDPAYTLAYYNRGILFDSMGDYDNALADYSTVIELMPEAINTYLSRARIHSLQENPQAALEDYDTVIEMNPDLPEPYIMRGHAHTQAENTQAAAADYAEWLLHIETQRRTHAATSADLNRRLVMRYGQIHEVPFEGLAGQQLTAAATSRTVDALLVVLGPDGTALVADDDSGENLDAAINRFELPRTGRYTLLVGHARGGWDGLIALSMRFDQLL